MSNIEPKLLTTEELAAISKATAYDHVAFATERSLLDHIIVLSKQRDEMRAALISDHERLKMLAPAAWFYHKNCQTCALLARTAPEATK